MLIGKVRGRLKATAVIAHRVFKIKDGQLNSIFFQRVGVPWEVGKVKSADQAPRRHNSHGIYAFKRRSQVRHEAVYGRVTGQVLLFGKIMEHDKGYRAEHAVLLKLYEPKAKA